MISTLEFLENLKDYPIVTNNKHISYYNIPAAFDIEASSFKIGEDEKRAIMYIWMFGIDDMVTYGRTWDEFKKFIKVLSTVLNLSYSLRLPVYVHNYAYEFQWIRKKFEWDECFLTEERKPVYSSSNGIEFRCSLKLSGGKSLENVAKDLQHHSVKKLVGNLDYSLIRTPLTPLNEKEMAYCENDIRVLLAYISEKIEQDGDVTKIPLTNTGYVRNYCRKNCYSNWKQYRRFITQLTVDPEEYSQLKRGFQGGFTHANAHYVQQIIPNVASYDLTSSYPTVMVLEKFPMSKGRRLNSDISPSDFIQLLDHYCVMFDLEMWDVVPLLNQDHPISTSKCWELVDPIVDNGRLVSARHLKTTCTEQDFHVYTRFYSPDKWSVSNVIIYEKQYLPKPFVKSILKLYKDKTTLKGIEEEKINYMISKNMINSAYGMTVTAIVRDDLKYVDNHFQKQIPDVEKQIEQYNNHKRRFLFYPWGVWVTAYARSNLFSAIVECGDDYLYADTDSVKIVNYTKHQEYFNNYEQDIDRKILDAANFHRLPLDEFSPLNSKGKPAKLGVWTFEGVYDEFKTLGAKRYLVKEGDQYELTVAGVNKKKACEFLVETGDPFGKFDNGLVVPEDYTKRLILTYIDEETSGTVVDYTGVPYNYHETSSVHMEPTEYTMSMSDQFMTYLRGMRDFSE